MKKTATRLGLVLILTGLLSACRPSDSQLEGALRLAKENRPELEKVLQHYQNDSLKLEAAKFLIRHMPGHYSFADTACIYRYYDAIDSALVSMQGKSVWEIKDSLEVITDKFTPLMDYSKVADVEIMTADYLIQNIDTAFAQWEHGKWATHLNFDQFCEYLLPYKIDELRSLDNWRSYLKAAYGNDLETIDYCDFYKNSAIQATIRVNTGLRNGLHPVFSTNRIIPVHRYSTKTKIPFGLCSDYTEIATMAFRSCGIPVAYDFTPQWPFRSMGHTWNSLLANNGKGIPFGGTESNPGEPHKLEDKMAKVFRRTYAANHELELLQKKEEYIPTTFRTPFIKDVTPEYMDCTDVTIEVDGEDGRYVYLSVFDNFSWVPIAFAAIKDGKACFRNMGRNIAYLPVRYEKDNTPIPANVPFVLTARGNIQKILPDTLHAQTVKLYRKYPVHPHVYTWAWRTVNGEFQAADNPEFKNARTIHKISKWGVVGTEVNVPDSCGAYRYWRYIQPHEFCNMAEIYFADRATHQLIEGEVIGTEGSWDNNGYDKFKAFDCDPLTYFDAPDHGAWTGMDFGKPVEIEKILYVGRGDGNTIEIGDNYELFYWNHNQWNSLGKQVADAMSLEYCNVPKGALLWLRNLTKGKEERIFLYEEGKQIWW